MPTEVRPLIERCLAKNPSQRPTADGLLAEVGALQPTSNWLPESIIRAFTRIPRRSRARHGRDTGHARHAGDARSGARRACGARVRRVGDTDHRGRRRGAGTGGESLLAPAGNQQTATSGSMPPPPGT